MCVYDESSSTTTTTKRIEIWSTFDLVMVNGSARMLIFEMDTQVLPIMFTIECGIINNF